MHWSHFLVFLFFHYCSYDMVRSQSNKVLHMGVWLGVSRWNIEFQCDTWKGSLIYTIFGCLPPITLLGIPTFSSFLNYHRIIQLEKTTKTMQSNCQPITNVPTKPCHSVRCILTYVPLKTLTNHHFYWCDIKRALPNFKMIGNISRGGKKKNKLDTFDIGVSEIQHAETRKASEAIIWSHFLSKGTWRASCTVKWDKPSSTACYSLN